MEVHHPHHSPKNWKEYLGEFLMLFLAVTLGFFVENYREHFIERQREQEFLHLIVKDIQMDIQMIDSNLYYRTIRADICKQFATVYQSETYKKNTGPFYFHGRRLHVRYLFERTDAGFQLLRNAGGLRLIHNPAIIQAIQHYENSISAIEKFQDGEMNYLREYAKSNADIFDVKVLMANSGGNVSNYYSNLLPQNNPPLISNDPQKLNAMMAHFYSMDKSNYVVMFFEEKLKKEGRQLINMIERQ
ncbi:MAG: hypothetical protein RL567_1051 [Bacteroidota bacterium]|jgi:hypothetical protein